MCQEEREERSYGIGGEPVLLEFFKTIVSESLSYTLLLIAFIIFRKIKLIILCNSDSKKKKKKWY